MITIVATIQNYFKKKLKLELIFLVKKKKEKKKPEHCEAL
jgi:hypothetical protein